MNLFELVFLVREDLPAARTRVRCRDDIPRLLHLPPQLRFLLCLRLVAVPRLPRNTLLRIRPLFLLRRVVFAKDPSHSLPNKFRSHQPRLPGTLLLLLLLLLLLSCNLHHHLLLLLPNNVRPPPHPAAGPPPPRHRPSLLEQALAFRPR